MPITPALFIVVANSGAAKREDGHVISGNILKREGYVQIRAYILTS